MLNLQEKLKNYIDKYKTKVIDVIKNPEISQIEEATIRSEQLSKCSKGDKAAKEYVLGLIRNILQTTVKIDSKDMNDIRKVVIDQYKILLEKKYKIYSEDSDTISYYQMIDMFKRDNYEEYLKKLDLDNISGLNEFAEAIYMDSYGNSLIDPLLDLKINNIEVHGTRKIKIETFSGKWKKIEDYRFSTDIKIKDVAAHIIAQDDKGEITEESCALEGTMACGYRVTIVLKPASYENTIFIKKFDGFVLTDISDLLRNGEINDEMYEELKVYAKGRANISFIGGVNSGKTTFMKAYVGLIPNEYKIGLIESDFEADLINLYPDKDIISFAETKKYSVNDLFITMLRTNRNILALGEARSYEVEQLIKAMLRGADGSFNTSHSRTAHDLINNLAWMSLENGMPMDIRILRYRIATAINIVVRLWHSPSGQRYVDSIDEITPVHDNLDMPYKVRNIFKYNMDTQEIEKTGNISKELREKFRYYNCTKEEIASIIKDTLPKGEKKNAD